MAATRTMSRITLRIGQSLHGTAANLATWSTDQVQINSTKRKIAAIPCCRKCTIWLSIQCMADSPGFLRAYAKENHAGGSASYGFSRRDRMSVNAVAAVKFRLPTLDAVGGFRSRPPGPSAQRRHPFILDRARVLARQRGGARKFVLPGERLACVDDHLRVRRLSTLARLGADARVERGTPGLPHDVDRFRGVV